MNHVQALSVVFDATDFSAVEKVIFSSPTTNPNLMDIDADLCSGKETAQMYTN